MRRGSRTAPAILVLLTLVAASGTRIDAMASSPRTLTFEQRLEAQRRIEEVLWARRIWPAANPTPKPPLASVLSEDALRIRVEDGLRRSNALVALRGHALGADELRAELERMVRDSRDPRTLTAIFAALGGDPFLEAEILARPALTERLLRSLYVQDASIGTSDATNPRPGYEPWWGEHRLEFSPEIAATDRAIDAVASPDASCTNDTWRPTANGVPDARANHTAVWTGTEMIVFGGDENENDNSPWRYVPATDTWTEGSHFGAPVERWGHASVWTGTEVLIWGGFITNYTNTGGRYSPATDSWTAMSVTNAPSPRRDAPAVWTGTEMIIWGGTSGAPLQTGGRYTPSSNTWSATSTTNAPTGRTGHTMVWSGSEAIVWGGYDGALKLNTGARYSPSSDQWTSVTTTGAPAARTLHSAVWSGTEMIVWGGTGATTALQTGGRYNPSTNKWTATSTTGAPTARSEQTAIWTGTQMIVWGGSAAGSGWPVAGGRYTPSTDLWSGTTTTGAPVGRTSHSAVWTGTEMIVFGGDMNYGDFRTGGRYFPSSDSWLPTSVGLGLTPRGANRAVWTGVEMLVWAEDGPSIQTGDRYLPATDSWSPMASAGGPTGAMRESAVWTGSEMIVWGGTHPTQGFTTVNDGGRYSPTNNQWTPTSLAGAPEARGQHVAVWTGSQMIVWGGGTDGIEGFLAVDTGGIYDPSSNGWTPTPTAGAPSPRRGHSGVWTGSELVVWGGGLDYGILETNDGGRYSPGANAWTPTALAGAPSARSDYEAVWSGAEMIVWGGSFSNSQYKNDGARYDASIDTWVSMSQSSAPTARTRHRAVWTGGEMIVWGGFPDDDVPGGRYSPGDDTWSSTTLVGAPFSRTGHSGVFTGDEAIFWGGGTTGGRYCAPCPNPVTAFRDQDGDGHGVRGAGYAYRCDGTVPAGFAATADDCNDANAAVHPGAPEVCNGLDDDCSNSVDDVAIPSGPLLVGASRDGDTLHLSWGTVVFATGYDVVKGDLATLRSTAGDFTVSTTSCLANDTTALTQDDPEVLASEQTRWYLVRPSNCSGAGSYEDDGNAASGIRDESITASPSACP